MRIGDITYFSPKYKFTDLNWNDRDKLMEAFQDRVKGFYLKPTEELNRSKYVFATGVMCVTTIDFLARIETSLDNVRKRFEDWLKSNIEQFNNPDPDKPPQTLAHRFYIEFRNGLVHEGRIKNAGQFSYHFKEELVRVKDGIMLVNPDHLLNAINNSFEKYMERVRSEELTFHQLRCALIKDFGKDVDRANRK